MAYSPHEWTRGETITSALLNHMEEGIKAALEASENDKELRDVITAFTMSLTETQAIMRRLESRIETLEGK